MEISKAELYDEDRGLFEKFEDHGYFGDTYPAHDKTLNFDKVYEMAFERGNKQNEI